jgi:GNAT superfamily N-acetyltransferase
MNFYEHAYGDYLLSDDPARLDVEAIHQFLSRDSYWATGVSRPVVERSLKNSLCIGAYAADGAQAGLVRIITDHATFAWLCDVFVLPAHRGAGLGKALVQVVIKHPTLQGVRRLALATRDAHGLYAQFGFTPLADPRTHMERRFRPTSPPGGSAD